MIQDNKTRKSLYPPIEVTLNGEAYQSRKFTHPLLIEKAPHEEVIEETESKKGESDIDFSKRQWDAYCNWMRIVFAVPVKKLEDVDFDEIEDAFSNVKTGLLKRDGNRMEKSVSEIKEVTAKIKKVTDLGKTVKELEKNVKGSGEKV